MPRRPSHDPRSVRPTIVRGIALLCTAIFVAELSLPGSVAVGGLYVAPVILSVWLHERRATRLIGALCTALTLASLFLVGGPEAHGWINRSVSIFAVWVTVHLVSERTRIEATLADSEERIATTLKSIADGVVTTDAKDRVTFLNAAAESLLGWTRESAEGRPLGVIFRGEAVGAEGEATPAAAADGDEPTRLVPARAETSVLTRSGEELPVEATAAEIQGGSDATVRGRVVVFRDIRERLRYQRAVEELAYRDSLTGLPNRNSFLDRLGLELAHAKRHQEPLALLYLDLDGFKQVNDTLGHQAGDRLLQLVAERLHDSVREGDTVARLSGDEFTVVLSRIGSAHNARHVAEKLERRLSEPYELDGRRVVATPSIGLAMYPADAEDIEGLLRRGDQAMYRAKRAGGGRVRDHERAAASPAS